MSKKPTSRLQTQAVLAQAKRTAENRPQPQRLGLSDLFAATHPGVKEADWRKALAAQQRLHHH